MTPHLTARWLDAPATQAVFAALEGGGYAARAVGGIVRNTLLGLPATDIDIATDAPPAETMRLAEAAGLKTIPTGIGHGTVTVIAHGTPIEVTTLRLDIATDGRRADVAFTNDWVADASRRDFTINALYCDRKGALFDPLGGLADLSPMKVRFIGDAAQRIGEDYLRILRFFRFTAIYSPDGALDPPGLAASTALCANLRQISGERIQSELFKLLAAPHAVRVAQALIACGVFDALFAPEGTSEPGPAAERGADGAALAKLAALEQCLGLPADAVLRLAAIAAVDERAVKRLDRRLKLAARDRNRLLALAQTARPLLLEMKELPAKALAYRIGPGLYKDAILLAWSRSSRDANDADSTELATLCDRWSAPVFPLSGADAIALGLKPGPEVGVLLGRVEADWIADGFKQSRDALIERLQRLASPAGNPPKA